MVEVDALTAARRARQRRKKELQRHGQAVLRRVLGVALLSAAALLYGASSGYTSHKDKEFGSGAGMLYGVGVVALPRRGRQEAESLLEGGSVFQRDQDRLGRGRAGDDDAVLSLRL